MSWQQVRAISNAGMDVQSHSHEHLVLNTLEPAAVKRDLERSADVLRDAVGHEVHSVAYPVGLVLEGAERRAPAEARFKLGFTNDTGLCKLDRFDPLSVPRVSMDIEDVGALHKFLLLEGGETRRRRMDLEERRLEIL
jgi:peptidoglycan/xylan/chitin deacetylase (PgdA/CDA1 family)